LKLYILDDTGKVMFEFSEVSIGFVLQETASEDDKVKGISILRAALKYLKQFKGV
jgi:hypothetical protein